jgi:cellobiose-specific phosphotransferase system component IIB
MRLEEVNLRLLSPQTPADAEEIELTLKLLRLHRATNKVNIEALQNQVRAEVEFQADYLLLNPNIATRIESHKQAVEGSHKRNLNKQHNKQLQHDNMPIPRQPRQAVSSQPSKRKLNKRKLET